MPVEIYYLCNKLLDIFSLPKGECFVREQMNTVFHTFIVDMYLICMYVNPVGSPVEHKATSSQC